MLTGILKNIHIFIIGWTIYAVYESYIAHVADFEKRKSDISGRKIILKKMQKEREQLNSYFADVEVAKKRIVVVASEIQKLQQQLPAKISDTENLDLLARTAKATNIKDVYLSPGKEELRGFYFAKKYTYKATATYLQFLIFFEKLAAEERILNVNSVKLVKKDDKQRGRFRVIDGVIEIEAYRYNANYKENSQLLKTEKK